MKKTFKRLSAVILALVMTLGMTVMASAATMSIYTREYNDVTKEKTYKTEPVTKITTKANESIYAALVRGNDLATVSYPNVTLSDQICPSTDFSIILSYDYSEFSWKN